MFVSTLLFYPQQSIKTFSFKKEGGRERGREEHAFSPKKHGRNKGKLVLL